jgi:hypothetical protein
MNLATYGTSVNEARIVSESRTANKRYVSNGRLFGAVRPNIPEEVTVINDLE